MKESIRLIQISDLHFGEQPGDLLAAGINTDDTFAAIADRIAALQPDWIVATGDLAQDPLPGTYRRLARAFDSLPVPVHALPGNHDNAAMLGRFLGDETGLLQRRVVLGNWQLLLLDTTWHEQPHRGRLGSSELAWLDRTLEKTSAYHSLVCLHHHPISVGSPWMDAIGLEDAGHLFESLARHAHVRGVLFGHVHQPFEGEWQGFRLFGAPATSLQFRPGSGEMVIDKRPPGLRYFDLHADGLLETAVEYLDSCSCNYGYEERRRA